MKTSPEEHKLKNLSTLGEFGIISRIASSVIPGTGVITGIGDDAAVTLPTSGMQLLTSTDMLLEDVHFRRSWHDPYRLGRKSLAVNISDIAAMGGIPRWTTLSLAIPADLPLDFIDDFTRGFLAVADEYNVSLIGGDTSASRGGFVISVTILGEQMPHQILRRSGARADDDIWVTGTLGNAALGLLLLENKKHGNGADICISRLLDPIPRVTAGIALADLGLASAMIDLSDGLLADFGHIAELSGVGGTIRFDDLPVSDAFDAAGRSLKAYPQHLLLCGGEEYELIFTALPENREKIQELMKKCGIRVTAVGIVTNSSEVMVVHNDGTPCIFTEPGYNHFR